VQLLPDPPEQAQTQPAKPTRFAGGLRSDVCRDRFLRFRPIDNGAIAQLGERLVCNQKVAGSIPAGSTSSTPPAIRAMTRAQTNHSAQRTGDGAAKRGFAPVLA
jgi:hypothetical protein